MLLFALLAGAAFLWRRNGANRQVWLMLLLAAVVAANVAIWTVPDRSGQTLLGSAPDTRPG